MRASQQTDWLANSLPKCAHIFEAASARNRKDWTIVRFHVDPARADPSDMHQIPGVIDVRTQALRKSKALAKSVDPDAREQEHMGVWRIVENGKVFWQTVWPV